MQLLDQYVGGLSVQSLVPALYICACLLACAQSSTKCRAMYAQLTVF